MGFAGSLLRLQRQQEFIVLLAYNEEVYAECGLIV